MIVPAADGMEAAVAALAAGALVAFPTDTVYGLAGDPERIYRAKRRPPERRLPVLVADRAQAEALVGPFSGFAARLADRWWPGPLTLVVAHGDTTVGLRQPAHDVAIALCRAAGPRPTTSANRHGEPSATTAKEVMAALGDEVAVVLDGGRCEGQASTVVDCTGAQPALLRAGGVAWEDICTEVGEGERPQ